MYIASAAAKKNSFFTEYPGLCHVRGIVQGLNVQIGTNLEWYIGNNMLIIETLAEEM